MDEKITSRQNRQIKQLRALHDKKGRDQQKAFIVEGWRLTAEVLASAYQVQNAFFSPRFLTLKQGQEQLDLLYKRQIPVFELSEELLAYAAATENPQGIVLTVEQKALTPPSFSTLPKRIVVLDGLADPGNVGTVLRTAAACSCDLLISCGNTADLYSPKVVRSSMGGLFRLPVCRLAAVSEAVAFLRSLNAQIFIADSRGESLFALKQLPEKTAFIFGSEAFGPAPEWIKQADQIVSLPMHNGVESLNVAVTAAVIMYEIFRRDLKK
ncbi:MAG: RNA methyltransferase [Clostridia bacterium]|nr:RNA methyltransferase [Clostridia bacterium]